MLDSIHLEKRGIPTALIITTIFRDFVLALAKAQGYPQFPVVVVQHPVAYLNDAELEARAREVVRQAVNIFARGAA